MGTTDPAFGRIARTLSDAPEVAIQNNDRTAIRGDFSRSRATPKSGTDGSHKSASASASEFCSCIGVAAKDLCRPSGRHNNDKDLLAGGCSLALPSRVDPAQGHASGTILPPMIAVRSGFCEAYGARSLLRPGIQCRFKHPIILKRPESPASADELLQSPREMRPLRRSDVPLPRCVTPTAARQRFRHTCATAYA